MMKNGVTMSSFFCMFKSLEKGKIQISPTCPVLKYVPLKKKDKKKVDEFQLFPRRWRPKRVRPRDRETPI